MHLEMRQDCHVWTVIKDSGMVAENQQGGHAEARPSGLLLGAGSSCPNYQRPQSGLPYPVPPLSSLIFILSPPESSPRFLEP